MFCYAIKNKKYGGYLRKLNIFHPQPEFYETINIDTVIGQVNDLENFIRIYDIKDCKVVKVEIREVCDDK